MSTIRFANGRVVTAAGTLDGATFTLAGGRIAAIDAVHVDIGDERGLRREAHDAAASGFQASACIHPGQVETIRAAYRPDAETLAWAHGVLAAAEGERGVFRYEGRMVDEPVLRHARSVLARA